MRLEHREIEELSVEACLALLGGAKVGRLAYLHEGAPTIVPVNFLLDEGMIVMRVTYGTTLDSVGAGVRVAFEVDELDQEHHRGWSVVVHGKAEEIWLPDELAAVRQLPLRPWAPGDRAHYVRIMPSAISGRRISEGVSHHDH